MKNRTFSFLLAFSAWGISACSSPQPDPRDLFFLASEAAEATPRVRYRFEATVSDSEGVQRLSGTALIERLDLSGSSFRGRLEGTLTSDSDATRSQLVAVRQRDNVYLLDASARVAQHGSLYAGGSSLLCRFDPALMYAFYDPRAVATEAEADLVIAEGMSEVHGEPCNLIRVS